MSFAKDEIFSNLKPFIHSNIILEIITLLIFQHHRMIDYIISKIRYVGEQCESLYT